MDWRAYIHFSSVRILRRMGFDVVAIIEDSPGLADLKVLQQAHQDGGILRSWMESRSASDR